MKYLNPVILRVSSLTLLMAAARFAAADTPPPPAPASMTPPAPAADAPPADTSPEHTSYLFGLTFAEQLHTVGIGAQVDQQAIARGIKDGLDGKKSTRADQQQIQTFVRQVMADTVAHNKQVAKEFLDKNGKEKAVKTTASGLQYKVLVPGNVKAPAVNATDEVTVQYRGRLIDGSEFDSSYQRGQPATFRVNGVIKGWQEGLVLMKPGSKYELFVPPELAYDANPRPGIPAGSLLIFDVELVSAKPAEAPHAGDAPAGPPGTMPGRKPPAPAPAGAPTPPAPPVQNLDH
jgi:FKBP-type peptidyl-prolyl cis-trans isomerase